MHPEHLDILPVGHGVPRGRGPARCGVGRLRHLPPAPEQRGGGGPCLLGAGEARCAAAPLLARHGSQSCCINIAMAWHATCVLLRCRSTDSPCPCEFIWRLGACLTFYIARSWMCTHCDLRPAVVRCRAPLTPLQWATTPTPAATWAAPCRHGPCVQPVSAWPAQGCPAISFSRHAPSPDMRTMKGCSPAHSHVQRLKDQLMRHLVKQRGPASAVLARITASYDR